MGATVAPRTTSLKTSRRGRVAPFIVMEVLAAANKRATAGGDVAHLEVGEPGGGAPQAVVDAAHRTLDGARCGYTEALGLPALRHRIARHYRDWYGVSVDTDQVAVTAGASGAFVLAFLATFDPGDRVAVTEPGYPAYKNILAALGADVVRVETGPETRFQPTPAMLDAEAGHLDGLLIASPANPTGTMLGREELADLAAHCSARGIRLVADEIYHGIVYREPAQTVLACTDDAIVINSFSKYFCMTGWRLGWMIVPPDLVEPVERLAQNLYISPPTISQHAALAAFDCEPELDANIARYRRNRDLLLRELPAAGLERLAPADGAFYVYADTSHIMRDSATLCARLLDETGVAVTPGIDFDTERGGDYIRLSFAGSESEVAAGCRRLCDWLRAETAR